MHFNQTFIWVRFIQKLQLFPVMVVEMSALIRSLLVNVFNSIIEAATA